MHTQSLYFAHKIELLFNITIISITIHSKKKIKENFKIIARIKQQTLSKKNESQRKIPVSIECPNATDVSERRFWKKKQQMYVNKKKEPLH